jgi:hypothetical protein
VTFLVPAHGLHNVTRGKRDSGAVGSGTDEAAVSAELTADVARFIEAFTDVSLVPFGTLDERITWLMQRMDADDWAFSLHMNAGGGSGTEVVYDDQKPHLKDEAQRLSKSISAGLGLPDRGAKPDSSTPRKYLGLVSRPKGRSFIIETAFQDRPSDVAAVRSRGPAVIAEAIRDVMGIPHPTSMPAAFSPSPEQSSAFAEMLSIGYYTSGTPRTQDRYEQAVLTKRLIAILDARYARKQA